MKDQDFLLEDESVDMPMETLKLIQTTAVQAASADGKVKILERLPDPSKWGEVKADGTLVQHKKPREARMHSLTRASEVVSFVLYAIAELAAKPVIWAQLDRVRVTLSDDGASDRWDDLVSLDLEYSPQFQKLLELSEMPQHISQKDFIRMLRMTFLTSLGPNADKIIKTLRSLKTVETVNGQASIQKGRESMGRDLMSETQGTDGEAIPEMLRFNVPVYKDPSLQVMAVVDCDLEVVPGTNSFLMEPFAESLEEAENKAIDALFTLCKSAGVPVFIGLPS